MGQYSQLMSIMEYNYKYEIEKIMLDELKNISTDFEESIIYMQNLFLEEKTSILYAFVNERIIKISIIDKEMYKLNVKCCSKFEIRDLSYEKVFYNNTYKISFVMNDEECILDPSCDTNEFRSNNYNNIAASIIQYFNN